MTYDEALQQWSSTPTDAATALKAIYPLKEAAFREGYKAGLEEGKKWEPAAVPGYYKLREDPKLRTVRVAGEAEKLLADKRWSEVRKQLEELKRDLLQLRSDLTGTRKDLTEQTYALRGSMRDVATLDAGLTKRCDETDERLGILTATVQFLDSATAEIIRKETCNAG